MSQGRPAIPIAIRREVLLQARHRCAVCCEPTPLEHAHIRPWSTSQDHAVTNLIALCANCHERADKEHWGTDALKRYKQEPCALQRDRLPAVSPFQKALLDLIVGTDPDKMTENERLRLVSMIAAYADVQISVVSVVSVQPANSTRVRLELPSEAAAKLLDGFQSGDMRLLAFLEDFSLLGVELVTPTASQPKFQVGQIISLAVQPDRQGTVIQILPPIDGRHRYKVFHSAQQVREYYEEQLLPVGETAQQDETHAISEMAQWLPTREFLARLTAFRLANALTDNLYALHAARIKFIPFQFKPLLRLLRSDRPRILIADEVGVGKTIEAGLILKELQSRQRLDNVVVICPKALVTKWRAEMRRFDEDFHPLTAETLRYCLRETHFDGAWPAKYSRVVIHLELFRNPSYLFGTEGANARPGLATLNPPAQFSLAIFDEAHHLRNTKTNSNQLARFICDNTAAVLLLSATPVQLGSKNLFVLLNLIRPDLFPDEAVFNEMAAPNRELNQAMRHVRSRRPDATWQQDAAQALAHAGATSWGSRALVTDPRFHDWVQKLTATTPTTDAERVRCLRDLEDLHTLAHVMNRTRRRDIGRFTIREPHTISVPFLPAQEEFYRELIQFRCDLLLLRYDPLVIRLIIDMLERQASSCLPALLPSLDAFLETGRFSPSRVTDSEDEDAEDFEMPAPIRAKAQKLRHLAAQLPSEDPKLEALLRIANSTKGVPGAGKLLVFSYFLHTLHYLERKLLAGGFRVGLVTGQVEDDEREQLRTRFRQPTIDPKAVDILLSSEVGCEGLDYEFCDRMVNYDIPWNPMRLEQRIGRIDRFGQRSEKVLIFNFITPGTVEERIFFRCFERLGIFRDTVGDCEEVLGEQSVTEQLLELARNPSLTSEQADEKARQIADNAARLVEEQKRLETEGSALLGLDQSLTDEVNDIDAKGRFVSPNELRAMIAFFAEQSFLGGKLEQDKQDPNLFRLRLNQEARARLAHQLRNRQPTDRSLAEFRRWLDAGETNLLLTFSQEVALERRDLPFITPVHPLARLATEHLKQRHKPLAAWLRVRSATVPSGTFVFACDLWETVAITPGIQIVGLAWDLKKNRPAEEISAQLLPLLAQGEFSTAPTDPPPPGAQEAISSLDVWMHRERDTALTELRVRNEQLVTRKLASLDAYQQNRLARIEKELSAAREERIIRMKTSEKARAERDHLARRQEIEARRNADIIRDRIAIGILEVHDGR
jgi:ATP-dependent helicase HepA